MKVCYKCKATKDSIEFTKAKRQKDGLSRRCKDCDKIESATKVEYRKEYRKINSERLKIQRIEYVKTDAFIERQKTKIPNREYNRKYGKEYRANNKDKFTQYRKRYVEKNKDKLYLYQKEYKKNNKEYINEQLRKYGQVNKKVLREKANERRRERMKIDVSFRLLHNLRRRFGLIIKGKRKADTTKNLIGCDLESLKEHLQNKFYSKMTWDNYGKYWEVDHIIPCDKFNLIDADEQRRCFHYSNLQPLTSSDNRSKSNKII